MSNKTTCAVCGKECDVGTHHYIEMRDPVWEVSPFWACDDCADSEERLKKYLAQHATIRPEKEGEIQ